ncbi:MAG: hypothetical protein IID30_02615 [Planctomycetes bacterium]|nr:hypothetical protein [Planctomycetota bacterium]
MFEIAKLSGTPEREIPLGTMRGTQIPNAVAIAEVPDYASRRYDRMRMSHQWEQRKHPCGIYNCFGHVFATRRTSIYDDENMWIRLIQAEDGYRLIGPSDQAVVGDIALYLHKADLSFLHVGRIVVADYTGDLPLIKVLSKWNDTAGEDIHVIHDVPYPSMGLECEIEIWTDRRGDT